jgi:hypothetical protein
MLSESEMRCTLPEWSQKSALGNDHLYADHHGNFGDSDAVSVRECRDAEREKPALVKRVVCAARVRIPGVRSETWGRDTFDVLVSQALSLNIPARTVTL